MKHIIITGHYGSGKSNVAVNMALERSGEDTKPVILIDADIVNPYFRSLDSKDEMEQHGIKVLAPVYANTNLDVPSLPAEIHQVFSRDCTAIWYIGVDEAGATVLGRYSARIADQGYEMLYVVNFFRPLSSDDSDMAQLLREIERASCLKATGLINNSNLGDETTAKDILDSIERTEKFAEETGLPVKKTTVKSDLAGNPELNRHTITPIEIVTKKYW